MNEESKIISLISGVLPRSTQQINRLFEADSEVIRYRGGKLLYNIDEFSQEDLFRDDDPYTLGWNIAVGAISDILATGGTPLYYAHSLVVSKNWTEDYIKLFAAGIADVLKKAGVSFIGGDFGRSEIWRCTATVIGELEGEPLMRSGARAGDSIYISGRIGLGNIEAGLKLYADKKLLKKLTQPVKNRFALRMEEALMIKEYASSCIDTSDGVFNALNAISEMSNTGYIIDDLPYIKAGLLLAKALSMPRTLLFLGECGEYELLFTVRKEIEADFLNKAKENNLVYYKIGEVTERSVRVLNEDGKKYGLSNLNIRARDFDFPKEYLNGLTAFLKRCTL